MKSCQTSFHKRTQPPLLSVMKQCQKTWLFIIIFSAIRVWKLNDWVALQMSSIINAAYEQRLFTMLSSNLIKMFKVKRNILTLYEQKSIKSLFSSVLVFCSQNFEVYIDISIFQALFNFPSQVWVIERRQVLDKLRSANSIIMWISRLWLSIKKKTEENKQNKKMQNTCSLCRLFSH